ncbi:MAG: Crp/Fnr family transcriptional regulator [Gammaproteobacteria bacterium]|nr:Crp/Fnr family transcriptional regulator [Gammaproteobacteria bacterium]
MENTQLLEVINKLCNLSKTVLDTFQSIFIDKEIAKGECFITEGDYGDSFAFIKSGLLRSYYISPKGEEYNKHFFLAGSFVAPLTSLVLHEPSPVYIGALESTKIMVANYKDLEKLYNAHLELNILGRKLVEFAWIEKERRETQLIMLEAKDRYKAFLKEYPGLEQRIPQYHVASYLGITPVQLSRIRAKRIS